MLLRWIARTYEVDAGPRRGARLPRSARSRTAELADDRNALGHALNVLAAVRWRQGDLDRGGAALPRAADSAAPARPIRGSRST